MLESQKNFAIYLKKLHGLLNDYAFSFDQTLLEKVLETELVVPVIGAFSAGKSSLLNTLIGQNVLPVGIAPETELATELRYSAEEQSSSLSFSVGSFLFSACTPPQAKPNPIAATAITFLISASY